MGASRNYTLQINEAASGGTTTYYLNFDRRVEIENISIVAGATMTAVPSNYNTLTWYGNDGATALCGRNTNSAGTGTTITAGTSEDLTLINMNKSNFSGSQSMRIVSDQAGSGVATNLTINVLARDGRYFS